MFLIGVLDSGRRAGPGVPNIGTATDVGTARAFNNGAATVTFTAGSGVTPTSYTVKAYNNADVYQGISATGASSPITITGLASNTQYKFTVFATAGSNSSAESAFSNTITATTIPQAPTIGTATAGNTSATVAYTANATGGKTVTYTATSTPGSFTGTGASPITVSGLTNGTAYTFTVTASNANGSATSAASNSVTPFIPQYIIAGTQTVFPEPGVRIFNWSANGFGTQTFNTTSASNTQLSSTQTKIAYAGGAFVRVATFANGSFGTVYSGFLQGPTTSSNTLSSVAINPAESAVLGGWNTGSTNRFLGAPFSTATGIGTKYADVSPAITTSQIGSVAFSSSGNAAGFGGSTGGSVQIFPFSASTGFGTKYSGGTIAGVGGGLQWSSNNSLVAMVHGTDQGVSVYNWSSSGYGSRYINPVTTPTGSNQTSRIVWNPSNNALALTSTTSPYIYAYPWNNGFGTKYANPATLPVSAGRALSFSKTGTEIALITSTTAPHIVAYPWNNGFGTKYANPPADLTVPATASGTSLDFARI